MTSHNNKISHTNWCGTENKTVKVEWTSTTEEKEKKNKWKKFKSYCKKDWQKFKNKSIKGKIKSIFKIIIISTILIVTSPVTIPIIILMLLFWKWIPWI